MPRPQQYAVELHPVSRSHKHNTAHLRAQQSSRWVRPRPLHHLTAPLPRPQVGVAGAGWATNLQATPTAPNTAAYVEMGGVNQWPRPQRLQLKAGAKVIISLSISRCWVSKKGRGSVLINQENIFLFLIFLTNQAAGMGSFGYRGSLNNNGGKSYLSPHLVLPAGLLTTPSFHSGHAHNSIIPQSMRTRSPHGKYRGPQGY